MHILINHKLYQIFCYLVWQCASEYLYLKPAVLTTPRRLSNKRFRQDRKE